MPNVKSFKAACKALNIDSLLPDVTGLSKKHSDAIVAYYQLVIIVEALNEGWQPNWKDTSEVKYFIWWDMENGFVLHSVNYACTYSDVGSRLCFKSRDLAEYAAKQFKPLFKKYMVV